MRTTTDLIYTTKPYEHQREALEIAWGNPAFAYFLEQGTGKSKIVVDETVNLIERDLINCVIVLAPNLVHQNWKEQFETHGPPNPKWVIQVYSSKYKNNEEQTRAIINSGKILVFLMNIEALSHKNACDYLYRILRARSKTYLCVDESHKIKTPGALRTKNIIVLGQYAKYRRITTGTEAEEGIHNLFSQMKFLDWQIIGNRSFTSFKSMYCLMGGYENRQIIGYQNQQLLALKIAPYAYQKRKKDCLDLPEKVYVTHEVELSKEQKELYESLEETLLTELADGTIVDTTMMLTRLVRLQQVLCGHLHNELIESYRARLVSEIVDSESGKSIIFCRFVRDVELVCKQLAVDDMESIGITGDTDNRMKLIDNWRSNPAIKALVMTTTTGGVGLTLNESSNTIFYSNHWSSTDRLQAEDRNHRIGQNDKVTYHDVIAKGKIDSRILRSLREKKNLADEFRSLLAGDKLANLMEMLRGD